jgi:hypothetical protein
VEFFILKLQKYGLAVICGPGLRGKLVEQEKIGGTWHVPGLVIYELKTVLKDTVSRDFRPVFFHKSIVSRPLSNTLKYSRILFRIHGDNRDYLL